MSNNRQDSWNDEHDQILAETVLHHIKSGSTQLAAFEETASKLSRTPAACGFRWNKELRKQYEVEISDAKSSRVKKKAKLEVFVNGLPLEDEVSLSPSNHSWDYFLKFLREQRETMERLIKYTQQLEKENEDLKHRLEASRTPEIEANGDYQALMQIMKRAKGLGVLRVPEAHV